MYKVIIVDDEFFIRQGLETTVEWQKYDCEVVATAQSGEEGIELIKQYKPDIIFTDIKMSHISGLDMLELSQGINPSSKLIIITGYRDFEYAQRAISLGVFAFLLKPTKLKEIHEILQKAVSQLDEERSDNTELILIERLFYDYLNGIKTVTADDLEEITQSLGAVDKYVLILIENDLENEENTNRDLYQYEISDVAKDYFDGHFILSIPINAVRIAVLLRNSSEILDQCYALKRQIKNDFKFTVSIGISSVGEALSDLPEKYAECQKALEQKGYIGEGAVISAADIEMFFDYSDFVVLEKLHERVVNCVMDEKLDEARGVCQEIYAHLTGIAKEVNRDIHDYYWSIVDELDNLIYTENKKTAERLKKINACRSFEELNSYILEFAEECVCKISEESKEKIDPKVLEIKKYIENNYSKTIRLADIGNYIYVSPYYASRIFKRETGISISEYINIVRIEKAKELLADVRNKIYEISEMVGIEDSRYFSKLMKRMTGYTPKEYRKQCIQEDKTRP